ncbi:MAG: site-specific DNA-methyltransferase [Pseudomonadota bacterium]
MPEFQIYNTDYREVLARILENGPVDAAVFDPPYVIDTRGGGKYRKKRPMLNRIEKQNLHKGFNLEILSWKTANQIICFCSDEQIVPVKARLQQGFHRAILCQFHKKNPQPVANKHRRPDTEFFIHAWQKGWHPVGTLQDKSRWMMASRPERFPFINSDGEEDNHPTIKPLSVMQWIMRTLQGDIVIDPFMGTGTTGVAALQAGKRFIGAEIVPEYFQIAEQRLSEVA